MDLVAHRLERRAAVGRTKCAHAGNVDAVCVARVDGDRKVIRRLSPEVTTVRAAVDAADGELRPRILKLIEPVQPEQPAVRGVGDEREDLIGGGRRDRDFNATDECLITGERGKLRPGDAGVCRTKYAAMREDGLIAVAGIENIRARWVSDNTRDAAGEHHRPARAARVRSQHAGVRPGEDDGARRASGGGTIDGKTREPHGAGGAEWNAVRDGCPRVAAVDRSKHAAPGGVLIELTRAGIDDRRIPRVDCDRAGVERTLSIGQWRPRRTQRGATPHAARRRPDDQRSARHDTRRNTRDATGVELRTGAEESRPRIEQAERAEWAPSAGEEREATAIGEGGARRRATSKENRVVRTHVEWVHTLKPEPFVARFLIFLGNVRVLRAQTLGRRQSQSQRRYHTECARADPTSPACGFSHR